MGTTWRPNTPFFLQSNSQGLTVNGSYIRGRGLCWSGLVTSEKPGLATLKLAVNDINLERYFTDSKSNGGQGVLFEHDFLVIWMQSQAPVITEVPTPGDPAGDGTFKPVLQSDGSYAFEPGLIKAEVKGTFPLGQQLGRPRPSDGDAAGRLGMAPGSLRHGCLAAREPRPRSCRLALRVQPLGHPRR